MDVECIKVIGGFEGSKLKDDPWKYKQIQHAVRLELGATEGSAYQVVTGQ